MRSLTGNLKRNITAVSSVKQLPIVLLEISSDLLISPVYICNNDKKIISNSKEYIPLPLEFSYANDDDGAMPKATIKIANVGRELTRWIDLSVGGLGSRVTYKIIEVDSPDYIQFENTAGIVSTSLNNKVISISISYDYILGKDVLPMKYNANNAEGLF